LRRRPALWVSIGLVVTIGAARAADLLPPLRDWTLPLFTDENFRSMTARGSEARSMGPHQFQVADLNLTLFAGDATNRVETVILSPSALFDSEAKTATGEKSVRFIRDEVDATGTRWTYWHDQKKVSLDGNVHVILRAEMPDLLK
jgi:hypothetical protein